MPVLASSQFISFLFDFLSRAGFFPSLLLISIATTCSALEYSTTNPDEPIQPVSEDKSLNPDKILLGRSLFFDPRLSRDNSISCANCHVLQKGGMDNQKVSTRVNQAKGELNAPTVYNTRFNLAQFWDGRAYTLAEQVSDPVHNPVEMATTWPDVVARLKKDRVFTRQFEKIYPDGLNVANISNAIAEFEKSLNTINSPFNRYLAGDQNAISIQALQGYKLFKSFGCTACHQGANIGGNMYQKMGVMADYFSDRGTPISKADLGRYNVTLDEYDKYIFKVPGLRMAVMTAPYFHDGSEPTLRSAINKMTKYQLGREISDQEIQLIMDFLSSLVGEHVELKRP